MDDSGAKHARQEGKEEEAGGNFSISLFHSLLHIHSCALIEKLFYFRDFVSRVREKARQKCIPRTVPLEFLELSNFYQRDSAVLAPPLPRHASFVLSRRIWVVERRVRD